MNKINVTPYIISVNIPNYGYSFLVFSSVENDRQILNMAKNCGLFEEDIDEYYAEVLVADEHDLILFDADDTPILIDWNTYFDNTSTSELLKMASKVDNKDAIIADVMKDYDVASEDMIRHFLYSVAKRGNMTEY